MPEFKLSYDVDPIRQAIAESCQIHWMTLQQREQWGWKPSFDLDKMTVDMLENLRKKFKIVIDGR